MANEIGAVYATSKTLYAIIRSSTNRVWNGSAFEAYQTANYLLYTNALTQQGTLGDFYAGNFSTIMSPGVYNVVVKNQVGVSPAETDPTIAMGQIQWDGSAVLPLSALPTSGQLARYLPIPAYQGQMIRPFVFNLVSAADSRTPFTSGTVSGQISRDGAAFGPLQSGAFTEMGQGYYSLQALTSGDLDARAIALNFSATKSGGGQSDPRGFVMIMQSVSG